MLAVPWPPIYQELLYALIRGEFHANGILDNNNELVNAILPPHNIYALILAIASRNEHAVAKMLELGNLDYIKPILSMLDKRYHANEPIYVFKNITTEWYRELLRYRLNTYDQNDNADIDVNNIIDIYLRFTEYYQHIVSDNRAWQILVSKITELHIDLLREYFHNAQLDTKIKLINASFVNPSTISADTKIELLQSAYDKSDDEFMCLFLESYVQAENNNIPDFLSVESAINKRCEKSALKLLEIGNCDDIKIEQVPLLIWAIDNDKQDFVQYTVTKKMQINVKYNGETPLQRALHKGKNELAMNLIDAGARIDIRINESVAKSKRMKHTPLLIWAIDKKKSKVAYKVIENTENVNIVYYRETPLYIALCEGMIAIAEALITKGANVDTAIDGVPLLIWVIEKRYQEIALMILEQDVQINTEYQGNTPLSCALTLGLKNIAEILITKGAIVDTNIDGIPLLIWVIKKGYDEIAALIVVKNVQINAEHEGGTPLSCALAKGYYNLSKLLIAHVATIDINVESKPVIIWAIDNDKEDIAILVCEQNVQINAEYEGETPLSRALRRGMEDLAIFLIGKGASTEICLDGVPLVTWVIREKHNKIAPLVIEKADEIDLMYEGQTPLFEALLTKDMGLASLLLNRGANINEVIIVNERPLNYLIWSVLNEELDIFNWLIDNRADTNISVNNTSPLLEAIESNNELLAWKLCDNGARVNKDLIISALNKNLNILSIKMIELMRIDGHQIANVVAVSDTNTIQTDESSRLSIIPFNCTKDDIEDILSMSIRLEQVSVSYYICSIIKNNCLIVNSSLLLQALENRCDVVALALIEIGIQLDVTDEKGFTPLMFAVKNKLYGSIYRLLMCNCDVNAKNIHGKSAIDYAKNELKCILESYS